MSTFSFFHDIYSIEPGVTTNPAEAEIWKVKSYIRVF